MQSGFSPKLEVFDITLPLTPGMVNWPGNPPFRRELFKAVSRGDSSNVSAISLSCHAGTHVDAPYHSSDSGAGIEAIPLSVLIGPARVVELASTDKVTRADLNGVDLKGVERLLLKTRNSIYLKANEFIQDFVYVDEEAANYLVEKNIKLLGVDYFSVERHGDKLKPAHHILLSQGIVIVEAVDLSKVAPGDYELICLPLNILGSDGAPARVLLRELTVSK